MGCKNDLDFVSDMKKSLFIILSLLYGRMFFIVTYILDTIGRLCRVGRLLPARFYERFHLFDAGVEFH